MSKPAAREETGARDRIWSLVWAALALAVEMGTESSQPDERLREWVEAQTAVRDAALRLRQGDAQWLWRIMEEAGPGDPEGGWRTSVTSAAVGVIRPPTLDTRRRQGHGRGRGGGPVPRRRRRRGLSARR